MSHRIVQTIPVLSSNNLQRDLEWYRDYVGFEKLFGDAMYMGLARFNTQLHLQWHAGTTVDPVLSAKVKFFVQEIETYVEEFVSRGTIQLEQFQEKTPWGTKEFGFYDPNRNTIFFVENL